MTINENGYIFKANGNKVHHEEEIVILGGGIGGLCFAIALHRYDVIHSSSNYHDLMLM
jgi:aspartate oxidase